MGAYTTYMAKSHMGTNTSAKCEREMQHEGSDPIVRTGFAGSRRQDRRQRQSRENEIVGGCHENREPRGQCTRSRRVARILSAFALF